MDLKGTAASAGIGIGHVVVVEEPTLEYVSRTVEDTAAETDRFNAAVASYIDYTNSQAQSMREAVGEKEAEILTGHVVMISDPYMQGEMVKLIEGGMCAEDALVQICEMFATMFEATGDELTMQRATDVRDVKTGVLAELLNKRPVDMSALPLDSIVVTHDLTPSMTAGIRPGAVAGVVTETGGLTSHSAILARAMEIPAVLSVPGACHKLADGDLVIVDGSAGTIVIDPADDVLETARADQAAFAAERAELAKFIGCRTVTASGENLELFANIGKPDDATQSMERDAEGIAYNPDIQVGVMIETPAAAVIADLLAEEADFFSIGTNDLTGYTMCADRGNDKVRYLYSTYNPAVLRSIKRVIEEGNAAGIMVGMCGEAAADPTLIPLWIAFGLGEYSVSATSVLATRKTISLWTKDEACALADKVMQLKTASEIYETLQEAAR